MSNPTPPASGQDGGKAAPKVEKSVSTVFGEITWLMTQSPIYRHFTIADLEWLVMPAILLRQFRMFYHEDKPVGVVLYAFLSEEAEKRIEAGAPTMRPNDWKSGESLWIIEAIAPFGGASEMVDDLKKGQFPDREIKFRKIVSGTSPATKPA